MVALVRIGKEFRRVILPPAKDIDSIMYASTYHRVPELVSAVQNWNALAPISSSPDGDKEHKVAIPIKLWLGRGVISLKLRKAI
jgi:hypothetical protein